MNADRFDVVVVGAGLNGSWVAKELACGGMKVALLDAGSLLLSDVFVPSEGEYDPIAIGNQSHRLRLFLSGERQKALNLASQKKTHQYFLSRRDYPYETSGYRFNWSRVRVVGGRGHFWGRVLLRFSDCDLQRNWPLTYAELAPYYSEVEQLLELGGARSTSNLVPDGNYGRLRGFSAEERLFCQSVERLWPDRTSVVNHVAEYEPGPLSPMLQKAVESGNLTILERRVVVKLSNVSQKSVDICSIHTETGEQEIIRVPRVVLAASALETLRILLNSKSSRHPDGLGNSTGRLGKRILEHVYVDRFISIPRADLNAERMHQNPFKLNSEGTGFYMPPFAEFRRPDGAVQRYGGQGVISSSTGLYYLGLFGEMTPRDTNRIRLHSAKKDRYGLPIPVIEFSLDDVDQNMQRHMSRAAGEMTDAFFTDNGIAGRMPVGARVREWLSRSRTTVGSNHESGGAPMGSQPTSSIVSPENRLWDAENILICDSACFPSLPPQNPTLTSMALALRASRMLLQNA